MDIKISKPLFWTLLGATTVGFIDALYLTVEHYTHAIAPCYIGSCEKVLTSSYAVIYGVPVAVLGLVYYFSVLFLLALYLQSRNEKALLLAVLATPFGFLASLYFFALQAWVINAWCQYCLLSGAVSTIMFGIAVYFYSSSRRS